MWFENKSVKPDDRMILSKKENVVVCLREISFARTLKSELISKYRGK